MATSRRRRAPRLRAPPTELHRPPRGPAHALGRKRPRRLARTRHAQQPSTARRAPRAPAQAQRPSRPRGALRRSAVKVAPVHAALAHRRLPDRDSRARASARARRCIHLEAPSWWLPPLRSSESSPRRDCRRESVCSKTCSRACRSERRSGKALDLGSIRRAARLVYCPATPSRCDPGRGGRGTQRGSM